MTKAIKALTMALPATGAVAAGPDLDRYALVFRDDFDAPFALSGGLYGPWSPTPRRDSFFTNSPVSVFASGAERDPEGQPVGLAPFRVADGVLTIGAGTVSPAQRAALAALVQDPAERAKLDGARFFTGMLATDQTWAQTYGYFEIVARIPEGKGHWPAFWLAPAGIGWPPEIDMFEAYGRGIGAPTPKDDTFNVAVHFDAVDTAGKPTQSVDLVNPFDADAGGRAAEPRVRPHGAGRRLAFGRTFDARALGADIYGDFQVWAAEWTPERITYYFGSSRETLAPVFVAPTPPDANSPMYAIVNDQIGSTWGWDPVPGEEGRLFAADNGFEVQSVSVYLLKPTRTLAGAAAGATLVGGAGPLVITGTAGDDRIVAGPALTLAELGGGRDRVFLARGTNNLVLDGFGCDDRLVLEGFAFGASAETRARLHQVGADVWLVNGAYPADPQTVILRDTRLADICLEAIVSRWPETPNLWTSKRRSAAWLAPAAGGSSVVADPLGSRLADGGRPGVTLTGSAAGDLYRVGNGGTVIVEAPGGGVDTVTASRSYVLPANVENLVGGRGAGLVLTGNDGDNRLSGGGGGTVFVGAGGDDLILLGQSGPGQSGPESEAEAEPESGPAQGGRGARVVVGPGDGHDTIAGFGPGDVLVLRGVGVADAADALARIRRLGSDAVLDLGPAQSVTFRDLPEGLPRAANLRIEPGGQAPGAGAGDPLWRPNPAFAAAGAPP